jgi:16S rRNA (cytosine967-C5)-methyltransferase
VSGDPHGLRPRRAAAAMLSAVLDDGRSLDAARAAVEPGLDGPDRARAGDLAAAGLRWLAPVDRLLSGLMRQPIASRAHVARDALRLAVVEVGALGGAAHAAVDAAVRLTKEDRRSAPLAGLVNAVARRAAEAAPAALAADEARAEALPPWLIARLRKAYGGQGAAAIVAASLSDPPTDLTARDPATPADWAARLGGRLTPTGSIRLDRRGQISALPGFAEGAWWAQDAAAAIPARLLGPVAGRRVLDLCAAPGGKTLQLAAAGADVTALDVSDDRLNRLRENLSRTGLSARIVTADALDWRPDALFDAVLLDAPCTATGTLRRHPDIAHLRRADDVARMAALQDWLLDAAWAMVAPGGRLVFCTCSLLPEEGEARARAFRARTPDAEPAPVTPEEAGDPALVTPQGWLRCRPDLWAEDGGMDGFFAARFERRAEATSGA